MLKKIKILIVEDNEDERLFLKQGFADTGLYKVVGDVADGDEMLELLKRSSLPDVIFSDLNMPGRNGYEVIVDITTTSSLSHIPVIILTTAPVSPYAGRCRRLGASGFYTKPDTFLEYKDFGKEIYNDVKALVDSSSLQYCHIKNLKRAFVDYVCFPIIRLYNNLIHYGFQGKKQRRFKFAQANNRK
jgi:CheY-like chemotaxis protein